MTVEIVRKQVVGPAEPRKPARKPIATPAKMSTFAIYRAVRSMAIGDLLLSYPEMSREEAEKRIDGTEVCNPLHASALKLKAQL
jgi:hypothetical protein